LKKFLIGLVAVAALALVAGQTQAKFQEGVYLKSARIEIIAGESGEAQRYVNALGLLDSLAFYYGPVPEGFSLRYRILASYVEKEPNLEKKETHVNKLAVYLDSTDWACASPTVKDKYKKDCKTFVSLADSLRVKYWREFFNNGITQLSNIDEANKQIADASSDSSVIESAKFAAKASSDSALINFRMCVTLDPKEGRAFVALGTLYEKQKDYVQANEWLNKGLVHTSDSAQIIMSIAYNYIQGDHYELAIPYFLEYLKMQPSDTSIMYNLTVCYARAKQYDSVAAWYGRMLAIAPGNSDALRGMGQYFNSLAINANDSSKHYADAKNQATADKWGEIRTQRLDSSLAYLKKAFEADPKDQAGAEQYALIAAIRNKMPEAITVYEQLVQVNPGKADYWTSLGDCYLQNKELTKAKTAYEKVVELEPTNRPVMERLVELYRNDHQEDKAAALEKKLK
jgi:tetratricopeptide (TPR) repeat protein